jgi:hypothetical protein
VASERYRVTLTSFGDGPPPIIRLRHCLKRFVRDYGMRPTLVEELPAPGNAPACPVAGRSAAEATQGPGGGPDAATGRVDAREGMPG